MGTVGQKEEENPQHKAREVNLPGGHLHSLPSCSEMHNTPSTAMGAWDLSLQLRYSFRKGVRQSTPRTAFCVCVCMCGYSCFTTSKSEIEILLPHCHYLISIEELINVSG